MASNNNQNEAPNSGSTIHISETFFDKYKKLSSTAWLP